MKANKSHNFLISLVDYCTGVTFCTMAPPHPPRNMVRLASPPQGAILRPPFHSLILRSEKFPSQDKHFINSTQPSHPLLLYFFVKATSKTTKRLD